MRYIFLLLASFFIFSCSSYKNISYQKNDDIYHINSDNSELDNSELVVVNTTTTTRFVNIYQNDFVYTPLYANNWYNPYLGWNNSWNRFYWNHPNYWGWNNGLNTWNHPNYYWGWNNGFNTWNHPNYYWGWNNGLNTWNHPNYWGWNHPYQYNPYVWNRGRRGNYFSPRSVEPGRLTPNNSVRTNRNQSDRPTTRPISVRPTAPTRSNSPSVRPSTAPTRSNPSVRPTAPTRSNPSVRPTAPTRSNPSVRPTAPTRRGN
jgi:hypothetical protein